MAPTMEHPAWLWKLLRATFYEPCPVHKEDDDKPRKKQNPTDTSLFCLDCLVSACALCVANCGTHANHRKLQVYKASHKVSVRKRELSALMDVSEIQSFSVNGNAIYFLNPRGEESDGAVERNKGKGCVACGWAVKSESYCCLYCKVRSSGSESCSSSDQKSREEGESSGRSSITTQTMLKPNQSLSFWKRSRKGVPRRAPFF